MADVPLVLRVRTLVETVPASLPESANAILIRLEPSEHVNFGTTMTTIALVVDNSGSMDGTPREEVARAIGVIAPRFRPQDRVAGVAFGSDSNVFHHLGNDHGRLVRFGDIGYFQQNVGASGATNMAAGIRDGITEVQGDGGGRLLLLTDGHPYMGDHHDARNEALNAAREAAEKGVRITSLGFGSYDHAFMTELSALTGDTAFDMRNFSEAQHVFLDRILAAQDEIATNVSLEVEFLGSHRVLDAFTVHPHVNYHGPVRLPAHDKVWRMNLQPVERQKGLELLINLRHPQLPPGRRTVARIKLRYDVPSLGLHGQESTAEVLVTSSASLAAIASMDAAVKQRVRESETEKLRLRAAEAMAGGDADAAVQALETIKKVSQDRNVHAAATETIKKIRGGKGGDREVASLSTETQKKNRRRT